MHCWHHFAGQTHCLHAPCRCAYTNWSTTAHECDDFFTDPQAMSLFKQHIAKVAFRSNSITGVPYNLDATIMGALA